MLNTLTENLRMDLHEASPNVHVSLVLPGLVATDFAKHALGGPPRGALVSAMPSQAAADVAREIVALIEEPQAERYTNPALQDIVKRRFDPSSVRSQNPTT
jgi:short-subunit dehydrogenase